MMVKYSMMDVSTGDVFEMEMDVESVDSAIKEIVKMKIEFKQEFEIVNQEVHTYKDGVLSRIFYGFKVV